MKKAIVFMSGTLLIAGLMFAQTPQKPAKSPEPAKTEQSAKETKNAKDCPHIGKKECSMGKDSKGCCSHDKTSSQPAKTDSDKK